MKTVLIALVFVGTSALACPDAVKDAMAPSADKPVVAAVKAKPAATQRASTKAVTKVVAAKPATDVRKATTL
ncbi:hypothetical protein BurJ1DRAFT_3469 [Burkholderiales bacterium JOSHI_001]|nr:hypothetical protein BurJ1DRAFT_3469 [Burkholderiales bacterium JOSHI_001]